MQIRQEQSGDFERISAVNVAAFGGPDEAKLVELLRASGGDLVLSLVAVSDESQVTGHIAFSRMQIASAPEIQTVSLAPVSVRPDLQSQGIGSVLVRQGLELLRQRGEQVVFVLGHATYYPRFGFRADLASQFQSPYSGPHFFALELEPGCLAGKTGVLKYAPAFGSL